LSALEPSDRHAWNPAGQRPAAISPQELAREARAPGYDGFMYRSAQQYGSGSVALFGADAMRCVRLVAKLPLVSARDFAHRTAAEAIQGAKVFVRPVARLR
jgi:hypothetical protein